MADLLRAVPLLLCIAGPAAAQSRAGEWPVYGGDAGATKYSSLTQITRDNVAQLKEVWRWNVG